MRLRALTAAVATVLLISPGFAQDGVESTEVRKQSQHPIEEVIVTVTKRAESIQDISSAVSAFTGDTLQEHNIQDYQSLADLTPNMQTRSEEKVTIRGIGRARDGASPVAFHVNGIFLSVRGEPFYDIGALEVLRGPSGTVFGRNATAGAINAKWAKPEPQWGIGGDYRQSDLEEKQLRFFVNAPLLGDDDTRLLGRFAAIARKKDGLIDNLVTPDDGDDPYNTDDYFVRAYLTSEIGDDLLLGLRAIRYYNEPGGIATVASPSLETRRGGNLETLGAQPLPDDLTKVRSTLHQRYEQNFFKFSRIDGDATWTVNDVPWLGEVDIDFLAGVMRSRALNLYDLDGTEAAITEGRNIDRSVRRTAELRFTSQYDSGFDWLFGMFWYRQTATLDRNVDARTQASPNTINPFFPSFGSLDPTVIADAEAAVRGERSLDHSKAAFLNLNFDLSQLLGIDPDIRLTMGIRENRDTADVKIDSSTIDAIDPVDGQRISVVNDQNIHIRGEFEATTGEFGAKWFYNDDGMIYAKFSKGYKPGLVQRVDNETNAVAPEFLDSIEIGWKVSFLDRSVVMNLTAFSYDYQDLQVFKIISTGVRVDNAGRAFIKGAELELQWSPSANFYTQVAASYLDAVFDEFCGRDEELADQSTQPGCADDLPHNFKGARLSDAPEWSVSLLARYEFQLGDYGTLAPILKYTWTDEFQRREFDNPIDDIPAFSNTSFRIAWESPEKRYKVEAFAENIEDHDDIFFDHFSMLPPGDYSLLTINPPRTVGIQVEARL